MYTYIHYIYNTHITYIYIYIYIHAYIIYSYIFIFIVNPFTYPNYSVLIHPQKVERSPPLQNVNFSKCAI